MEGFFGELDTKESFLVQGFKKVWTTFWALRAGTPFLYAGLMLTGMLAPEVVMSWCFLPVAYETCKMGTYFYVKWSGRELEVVDLVLSGLQEDSKAK